MTTVKTAEQRVRRGLFLGALTGVIAVAGLIVADFGQLRDASGDAATFRDRAMAIGGTVVLLLAGLTAVRAMAGVARAAVEKRGGQGKAAPLGLLVSVAGYIVLALMILGALEIPLEGLLLGGALTGVAVGIAAQQTLGNFFAGLVLLVVRPFEVGEEVLLKSGALGGEYEGTITDMGLFYVNMVTARGQVALPNAGVLSSAVGPGARSVDPPDPDDSGPENPA
ncbi:MAG TPA: mechanosensitive ion channel family protein [Actinomycetota bacterium]|nr:mechanosensitive ion channel family protein [Actinomycetota bacterium]